MNNKYNEIMKKIEVTDEMKERILFNVDKADLNESVDLVLKKSQVNYKKYMPLVACLILVVAVYTLKDSILNIPGQQGQLDDPIIVGSPNASIFESKIELEDRVGFKLKEMENLPFEINSKVYTSYFDYIAEIEYIGENNTLYLRKALGSEDISEVFEDNLKVEKIYIQDIEVTIKENSSGYIVAIWESEGYSYSIRLLNGIDIEIIKVLCEKYIDL